MSQRNNNNKSTDLRLYTVKLMHYQLKWSIHVISDGHNKVKKQKSFQLQPETSGLQITPQEVPGSGNGIHCLALKSPHPPTIIYYVYNVHSRIYMCLHESYDEYNLIDL